MAADSDTIKFLEEVKKGKPRNFVMICKGVKIVSLIVYKKGTVETYKNKAKKEGKGQFFHGVVDGKGVDFAFKLSKSDGYEKPPGKELTLKDHLKTECGLKVKPRYEIVEELPRVDDSDDEGSTEEVASGETIDVSAIEARLKKLGPAIKAYVVDNPSERVAILKPSKVVKDYILDPANQSREAAENALETVESLVGAKPQATEEATSGLTAKQAGEQLKALGGAIKQFVVSHPERKADVLKPVKTVKDFIANPASGSEQAATALEAVKTLVTAAPKTETAAADDANNKAKATWDAKWPKIEKAVESAIKKNVPNVDTIRLRRNFALDKANEGQYADALKVLPGIAKLIKEAAAAASDPLAPWKAVAKDAVFQARRLQFALRGYEQELRGQLNSAGEEKANQMKIVMAGALAIADHMEEVVVALQADPNGEKFIEDLKLKMESEVVKAAERPNPFNLDVDISRPVIAGLTQLESALTPT
ncbi:MAG: hypothetical protein AAGG48_16470 [Planctomycetota bacterium]